jgi:hypothetical protein
MKIKRQSFYFWLPFSNYGVCFLKKENLLFSYRNGYKKYWSIGNFCFYILKNAV